MTLRVFVNEVPLTVPDGCSVQDAIQSLDPKLAAGIATGEVGVTDGVGRPIGGAEVLTPGSIIRAVRSARAARRDHS